MTRREGSKRLKPSTRHSEPWSVAILLAAGMLMAVPSLGRSQTIPDAGVLQQQPQQQIEQERRERLPAQAPSPAPVPPIHEPSPQAETVWVNDYRFEGNTLLTDEQLQSVVAPYAGRRADLTLLREAAAAVADRYRKAEWIVRTYLPQQDVSDGHILIAIVEAKVGDVALDDPPPTRVRPEHVLGPVQRSLTPGQYLNTTALDRGILLAGDLAGVRVSGALEAGAQPGQTNVHVTAADQPPVHGELSVNNGGLRATGPIQGLANLRIESPFHRGDRLALTGMFSEGSQYGRVGYTRPVGYDGWQVGANASWLSYDLVASEFASLNATGNAQSLGLEALYPVIRARNYNLQWLMNYDYRRFSNHAASVQQSNYQIHEGTVGMSGNWFEEVLGTPGVTSGSLSVVTGQVDQGSHQIGENPAVAGAFTKLRWYVSRQQQLIPWLSLFGSFLGQKAFSTMDSAERFYLGGPQNLRAFPVNETSGSTGWLATAEVRGQLPWGFDLTGFFDTGYVENSAAIGPS
ncbi:MAG: ShlB/FhaC/HecB family hemolysin secretion/activation protein, partial [Nitrospira sp.]|nr:ShlB/FhaC/HecB family hemolysin secretion/activation protein [Nitrospira sp.]